VLTVTQNPRLFLKRAIADNINDSKKEEITAITPEFMDKERDKRRKEKSD
jgi:hypothetical protein